MASNNPSEFVPDVKAIDELAMELKKATTTQGQIT
jgi:hypothetical protein